jgi:hypothetical protein
LPQSHGYRLNLTVISIAGPWLVLMSFSWLWLATSDRWSYAKDYHGCVSSKLCGTR